MTHAATDGSDTTGIQLNEHDAIVIVDIQNDFLEGGALAVQEGHLTVPVINSILPLFDNVVFTRDWHPPDHISFAAQPTYEDRSWPAHAVRNTPGAQFHKDLHVPEHALIVNKATLRDREEYSGFQASEIDLAKWLRDRGVLRLFIAGIATDYCVHHTALDGAGEGFQVFVVEDAVRGISADTVAQTWQILAAAGVTPVLSSHLHREPRTGR
ncbi:MAG: nicotinamidase [Actinobacteria bacterium]|nr:nicotinamidase [Actinomycetota bacterium]